MLNDAEQRQRIIEVARQQGVDCPELVVESVMTVFGTGHSGQVNYRCNEDAPVHHLMLDSEQAEYVGIDTAAHDQPETGA